MIRFWWADGSVDDVVSNQPCEHSPTGATQPVTQSNALTLGGSRSGRHGSVLLTIDVPGPGMLAAQQVSAGAKRHKHKRPVTLIQPTSATATQPGPVSLVLKPTAAARKRLRQHSLKVAVQLTFTGPSGTLDRQTTSIALKSLKQSSAAVRSWRGS
jgi:hypothetical protein